MKNYFQTHPFSKVGLLVIPLLFFIILMGQFFPNKAPEEFSSFIIAFEFAKIPADIQQLFNGLNEKIIRNVNIGNYLDYGFMATYTLLLALSSLKFSKEFDKKWLRMGIFLAMLAFIGDFTENIYLLRLSDDFLAKASKESFISNLACLHFFTWLKWGGLSVCFAFLSYLFFKGKWYSKIVGVTFMLPLLFLLTIPGNRPQMLTIFTNIIFLCFTLLIVYLFIYQKEKHKKS